MKPEAHRIRLIRSGRIVRVTREQAADRGLKLMEQLRV
jgi:hypothetical protein